MRVKSVLVVAVCTGLVFAPVAPAETSAAVAKMSTKGTVEVNGTVTPSEASVFDGDRIATRAKTAAALALSGGDQVFLPELSAALVRQTGGRVEMSLERGGLVVVSRGAQPVAVLAGGVRIVPSGAGILEIVVKGASLKVAARKGAARVEASNRTVDVTEGNTLDATVAPPPQGPVGASAGLTALQTAAIVSGIVAGVVGLTLGVVAFNRANPSDCRVTGTTSPFTISCP
jgi:ferric-dicitrate binding protein FerR (iron transport regulator)